VARGASDHRDDVLDEDLLGEDEGGDRVHRLLIRELGEPAAVLFARMRAGQEARERERRPREGLRERKKRLTRQRISDVATTLCVARGFEHVRVSEIADIVGVSEKTVYNYFPTKESMVFDVADEGVERLASALRERDENESPTSAVVRLLREDMDHFGELTESAPDFVTPFAEMIYATPSLRAAWLELHARLATVAAEELAAWAGIDPREPEPTIAAQALVGLQGVVFDSRLRHLAAGLRGSRLNDAIANDLDRAARLLEIGLGSFDLLSRSRRTRAQIAEAAHAAQAARAQVVDAIKEARAVWEQLRREQGPQRSRSPEYRQAKQAASQAGRAAWQSAREAQRAARDAARALEREHREEQRRARRTR
jgi:AcrR family transcriptional regulator